MNAAPRLLVVGSYNRDMVIRTARMPAAGETVTALGISFGHGGKGSNQAVQAASLGAPVSLVAAIGDDEAAAAAVLLWTAAGIDMQGAQRLPGVSTGTALVLVEPSGENRILVVPGANAMLGTANAANSAMDGSLGGVLAQLEVPLGAIKAAFSAARQRGAWTMLNAAPASAVTPSELRGLADTLVVNLGEAAALLGRESPPGRAARDLLDSCFARRAVVVTAGAAGAFVAVPGAPDIRQPAPAIAVRDSTGAGDAFTAALATELLDGQDIAHAVRMGVAAGSLACARDGAISALLTREMITTAAAGLPTQE